ncbi:MAG TPA: RidA family protein [Polyangiaceae bacterium]|nr:RidA family protein [Polyangiaceae bacterium]
MSRPPFEVRPAELPPPRGFAHGMVAEGRILSVAGQIGSGFDGRPVSDDFTEQFAQALDNVIAVVRTAGGAPEAIFQMTVFVTDLDAYLASSKRLREAWAARLGKHYPSMALVAVAGLVEPGAKVEIMALAAL